MINKRKQVLLGTLLGDGSLSSRSNSLKISHTEKQKDYLIWKKNILSDIFLQKEPNIETSKWSSNKQYSFSSIRSQELDFLSGLLYRNIKGKRVKIVKRKILNMLDPFGLLIWFLDDGHTAWPTVSNKKSFSSRLATYCFSLSENKAIKIWLWQKYRIEARIQYDSTHKSNYIVMNKDATVKLLELFNTYKEEIPSCMHYKLEPQRLHVSTIKKSYDIV